MKLKFCGFKNKIDIEKAIKCDPDYIGIVFAESKRRIDKVQALEMIKELDFGNIGLVGVFMNQELEEVIEIVDQVGLDIIQLHGSESNEYIGKLKSRFDGEIWKAIPGSKECIMFFNDIQADLILIDSTKGGGSGKTADWELIRRFQDDFNKPYILAGGLHAGNIKDALEILSPAGIDISSGIEIDGSKSFELMNEISRMVKSDG